MLKNARVRAFTISELLREKQQGAKITPSPHPPPPRLGLIDIEGNITNITSHARKFLLFDDSEAWVKKRWEPVIRCHNGSLDGAQV